MEFLKALFDGDQPLTYEQLAEKAKTAKINAVNIADGSYISRVKFDDKISTLSQQITDLQGQIAQRDTDMTGLKGKLDAAQADAEKLGGVQTSLSDLQTKYENERQAWESSVQKQAYEFAVREKVSGLKFTSPAAKRDFLSQVISKDFKVDGDSLLGYEDFVTKYKADNPGALAEENTVETPPPPTVVLPGGAKTPPPDKNAFGFQFHGVRPKPQEGAN